MDNNKELAALQSCMKNFDISTASELLSNTDIITKQNGNVINVLGKGLTEDNFINRPEYFNFCEEQLIKIAQTSDFQEVIVEFLELIDMHECKLSSTVLATVTIFENTESPNRVYLEYLLLSTFNSLKVMNEVNLKEILMSIIQHFLKLKKHLQHDQSMLHYFSRVAFLVLRAKIDPIEYINILSDIINDPFGLLEYEFEEMEEKLYLASFFYLYFKTGMSWGPKIYNHIYVLDKCSHLAMSVFENDDFGKSFVKLILNKFKDNEIPLQSLNKYHEEFCMEAAKSSMYSEHDVIRRIAIESLIIFIQKLSTNAQYITFKQLFLKSIEPSVKSHLIITMKNLILIKMKSNHDLGFFQGIRLFEIIQICCNIPNGPKCCVVENHALVLAAITFIYEMHAFLTAKHFSSFKKMLNISTEFYDYSEQFVKTVQNAIDHSTELYKLENKKLNGELLESNSVDNTSIQLNLAIKEKRTILSQFNTNITLVQAHLDTLKNAVENYRSSLEEI